MKNLKLGFAFIFLLTKGKEVHIMTVTVYKNDKESVDRVISRWNKKVQASRVLLTKRKRRYRMKPATKRQVRQKAVKREEYRAIREKNKFN